MEIQITQSISTSTSTQNTQSGAKNSSESNFASELQSAKETKEAKKTDDKNSKKIDEKTTENNNTNTDKKTDEQSKKTENNVDNAIDDLKGAVDEIKSQEYKIKEKEIVMIDNNMNIQEPADKLNLEMNSGMNMSFNSDGQPFASFVNQQKSQDKLSVNSKDLAEENAILSTMEENIAIANRNMMLKEKSTATVQNESGIKRVDTETNLTIDTIVKYDSVVMDKADVEFFVNLVDNGAVDLSEVQNVEKSSHVSKTLADLLAKSMNENKPVRIDFDNDISVIIKISRQGKITADFLPSSQVAEAYLKENLPLLKQRFDEKNIDYDELNQRKQKQDTQDNNRKKGRKDE